MDDNTENYTADHSGCIRQQINISNTITHLPTRCLRQPPAGLLHYTLPAHTPAGAHRHHQHSNTNKRQKPPPSHTTYRSPFSLPPKPAPSPPPPKKTFQHGIASDESRLHSPVQTLIYRVACVFGHLRLGQHTMLWPSHRQFKILRLDIST